MAPDSGFGPAFDALSPVRVSKVKESPVDAELERMGVGLAPAAKVTQFEGVPVDLHNYPDVWQEYQRLTIGDDNVFEYVSGRVANIGSWSFHQPLVQAGSGTAGASGSPAAITFAQAFPNSVKGVTAIHDGSNIACNVIVRNLSATGFAAENSTGGAVAIHWIAVGD